MAHNECVQEDVYVQAGPGSFNDQAISILQTKRRDLACKNLIFSGTPREAMKRASEEITGTGFVFTAVHNNIVGPIQPTAEGFRDYEPIQTVAAIKMGIEMCLIGRQGGTPVKQVASIKPALDQVGLWIRSKGHKTIEEPMGTSEAARKLSGGAYPPDTGVIAPRKVVDLYPGLKTLQCGIEDRPSFTEFALIKVRRRHSIVSDEAARASLEKIIEQARKLSTAGGLIP